MRSWRAGLLAAAIALASTCSNAEAQTPAPRSVVSGPLIAEVRGDPWGIAFVQAGAGALSERTATDASSYGTIGFSSGAVAPWGGLADLPDTAPWFHATRALSIASAGDGGLIARVATDDPLDRMLTVRIAPAGSGVVAVHATIDSPAGVTSMSDAFSSGADEHFSGFGGRENAVDQAGQTVQTWAEEGAWVPADRPFIPPFIEPWTYSTRDDGTYFPMPWLVSSRGYGFLLDDPQLSTFRLRSDRPDAWGVQVNAAQLDYRVFAGPAPLDVVRRFSALVGRQPAPVAPWELGPWWQPTGSAASTLPGRFRHDDVPGSLIQTYTHYLPCDGQAGNTTSERHQTESLHAAGYAVTTYFNPMICVQYQPTFNDAQSAGALLDSAAGQPDIVRYNQYVVAQVDFTSGAGRSLYRRLLQEAIDNGYDGWMEDFGEYTSPAAVASDGTPGSALHNLYPRQYHCGAYAIASAQPRPMVEFDRSGYTGSAACSPVVWSGDPTTDWSFDGLPGMAAMGISYGYSGVGVYGSDIGGYFSITAPPTGAELLARWLELGAFSGVMRTESEGFAGPQQTQPRAQIWDARIEPIWRRYAKLRTQLYPYVAAAAARYRSDGVPLMEGLGLAFPRDSASWTGPSRFLFGPDLLVAPVTAPGVTTAHVPVPPGRWRDIWQAVAYDERDGGFHLRAATPALPGGATADVSAPLAQIPVLVRDGALLALLPTDVATLANYGSGVVRLADRAGRLHLLAWPSGSSHAAALGTTLASRLSGSGWSLTVAGRAPTSLAIEAALGWRPSVVSWRGRALPSSAWSYGAGVLRTTVAGVGVLELRSGAAPRCVRRPARGRRTRHGCVVRGGRHGRRAR